MTITTFLDPSQMPDQTQDQSSFDNLVAQFFAKLPTLGAEINATVALFNAAASGAAYALPYKFSTTTTDADPGAGFLRLDNATQNAATTLRLDPVGSDSIDYTSVIDTFDASTSTVKGTIRLVKMGDISKFLIFSVTARATPTGYRNLTVANIGASAASPFANDDGVLLTFQRTGDKGNTGNDGNLPTLQMLKVSDRKAGAVAGGTNTAGWAFRTLNTVEKNTITGASLASDGVTLPAGTYRYRGRAPAGRVDGHQVVLYNVTDSTEAGIGSAALCPSALGQNMNTDSIVSGFLTTTATKVFKLRHYTQTQISLYGYGFYSSSGTNEVYSELEFEKLL